MDAVEADPELKGRVALLGFAVGNSVEEIEEFVDEYGARYPILSDKDKTLFTKTGNIRGTPQTYVVRRQEMEFIVDYHAGGVSSAERYLDSIRHTLRSSLVGTQPGFKVPPFSFKAAGKTYTPESLSGQRSIMYFAPERSYTVESDLRNMDNQLKVLEDIAAESGVKVFVFPPDEKVPQEHARPDVLFFGVDVGNAVRKVFAPDDTPVVLDINQYGRINYRDESITRKAARQLSEGREYELKPKMSEEKIRELIRRHITATGREVAEIELLTLENRQGLYVITVAPRGSGVFFFARLESGITMCDVCHDSHFVYLFDQTGTITGFIPIELTKYGNVPWTDEDTAKMSGNLVGRNIFEPFEFDPDVDAVTTATMSSSVIYESMNKARLYFKDFYEYGFREAYWQKQCFSVICKVKSLAEAARKNPGYVFDDAAVQALLKDNALSGCPTGGMYIVLDNDILCSAHGMNVQGCKQ
jgi:hypothetical protein